MIAETLGRFFYGILATLYGLIPSLSVSLVLAGPVLLLVVTLAYLWPAITKFRKRIRQVDDLPGPRSTSVVLGNVPAEMLKSLITGGDHKNLIISKWVAQGYS